MIGEILGNRYKLLREVGAGGMAWVYYAQDLTQDTQVAVKVLYPQFSQDMSYVQRFIREAKLARQLSSEHIVRILNYGADRDVHYLIMELIEGKDLATVLREQERLPWQEALRIVAQVALALETANLHEVVHRDIKPQNIMITDQGIVKVLDFGIARICALPSLTQTGFVGSPSYISPEQAMGEKVDIRSDIYSLGIVLFELLSGRLPFEASNPWSIISQHIAREPQTFSLHDLSLPPQIEALINRMLAKEPDDRYQSPGELLDAVNQILEPQGRDSLSPIQQRLTGLNKAHRLLLSSLYERAVEAAEEGEWQQAANLFDRIAGIDPEYEDVPQRLQSAERHARFAELYEAAQIALHEQRLQDAIDSLSEIVGVDASYRDTADLLTRAGIQLAEHNAQQRIEKLYRNAEAYYESGEWRQAEQCFAQVFEVDPRFRDVATMYPEARRRARWSSSILGRVGLKLVSLVSAEEPVSETAREGK